jgi:hypothetical protein
MEVGMKRTILALALGLSLPLAARAEVATYRQNEISYVSGGAGTEERKELDAMADRYNLKVTMAISTGNYVGGAKVNVRDASGKTVLDVVADGPILLAALESGTYTVSADYNGKKMEKSASVAEGKQHEVMFTWTSE